MIILTDLDDTLFQTERKFPQNGGKRVPMSYLADGSESGYATQQQQQLLGLISAGTVVPVTARSKDVLARVNIKQAPAICSNGGCIVSADGKVDSTWHASLTAISKSDRSVADFYADLVQGLSPGHFRHWIVSEGTLDLYAVIKSNVDQGEILAEMEMRVAALLPVAWRVHRNGNNLAILPFWLNKRNAAAYLIRTARQVNPHILIVGIGDSHSDVGFMDLCDFAMTPTISQIWKHIRRENNWCS